MAVLGRLPLGAAQDFVMRVNWVVTATYQLDPSISIDLIRAIGPIWGSWRTWRACSTDNVICHNQSKARELLDRAFQAVCNFHVPRACYEFLQRPVGVKLYEGEYREETEDIEDIIGLHLAAAQSDIVLMLGYDLRTIQPGSDRMTNHRNQNRHGLIRSVIANHPQVQWVLVDHPGDLDTAYRNLPNLTCDTMANALQLLA